jgi:serine protease Do
MRKPFTRILFVFFLLASYSQCLVAQDNQISLDDFRELEEKVVAVAKNCMAASVGLGSKERPENGSAVVVSEDGLLLTAYHVVEGLPDNNMIVSFVDGKKVRAKKLGGVPKLDIAMAQIIDEGEYPFVDIGDMKKVANGDWCVSIAHAEGFQSDRTPPVRLGRVVNRINGGGFLQMTSTLIGGDSGGPTFNLDGEVIGIHSNIGGSLDQNQACPISNFTKKDHWQRMFDGEVWGKPGEEAAKRKAEAEKKKKEAENKKKAKEEAEKKDNEKPEEPGDKDAVDKDAKQADSEKEMSDADAKSDQKSEPETKEPEKADSEEAADEEPESEGEMEQDKDPKGATKESTDQANDSDDKKQDPQKESEKEEPKSEAEDKPAKPKATNRKKPVKFETSLDAFKPRSAVFQDTIVRFWRRGRMICSGLILTNDGIIVTKSSELMSRNFEIELPGGELVEGKVLKRVKENDLLFVQVDRRFRGVLDLNQNEEEIKAIRELPLGSIVVAVGFGGKPVSMGVKSVEVRNLMQAGYAVLGVQLGTKQDDLSIKATPGDSAAKKAGIRPGDIITKIGGEEMTTLDQLREKLRSLEPNTRIPVEFTRDGRVAASLVKLGSSAARSDKGSMNYPQGGRISRKRMEFTEALQSDTPFDPMHVGAPLIDLNGRLLGVNIARAGRIKSYTLPCSTILAQLKTIQESETED